MPSIKKTPQPKITSKAKDSVIPALQESIISRVNPDKTVSIISLELDDFCYSLDGVAAEFWTLIDGKRSLKVIKSSITKKHSPPKEQFEADVSRLLEVLEKENLITLQ